MYENLCFNTAISQMMIFVNEAYKAEKIYEGFIEGLVLLLSPIIPHVGEELWEILGHKESLAYAKWPEYDEELTKENVVTYAVSVNGKLRDKIDVDASTSKEDVERIALASEKIRNYTDGHEIVKIIVVPNNIVNIVIK
jgi:leucyl-tRNA synthetase